MFGIFDFGANWEEFSKCRVDHRRVELACQSIQSLLEQESLIGKSFLDIGCGSGLFSIAAHRLGATRVVGLDVNPRCIGISQANRDLLAPGSSIEFHVASVLAPEQLKVFGTFDLVYAWGSLHHTGSMWNAIGNVTRCVGPNGMLILAIYNKHVTSPVWQGIKWLYNRVPVIVQRLMFLVFAGIIYIAKLLVTRANPLKKERGMDFWFDVVDWVGGYPYEFAAPSHVKDRLCEEGFVLRRFLPAHVPTGCNEFVFNRVIVRQK